MILLKIFLTFLEIGAVSFGGGYGMISIMHEKTLEFGLTEAEFLNFIAVSESTPGPIAVNMATFIGASQAGFFGSLVATIGVVLPSFVIILIISALLSNFLKYEPVKAALGTVRPCVVGLIVATGLTLFASNLLNFNGSAMTISPDYAGIGILAVLVGIHLIFTKVLKKKKPSALIMIAISALLGIIVSAVGL